MFDATCDFFNYGVLPKYFADLYEKGRYTGRSAVSVMGPVDDPTVYIGAYKADRTVMLYDKKAEYAAKGGDADEPEIITAVRARDENTWLRLEQHFTGKEGHSQQVFDYLLSDIWLSYWAQDADGKAWGSEPRLSLGEIEKKFWSRFSSFLKKQVSVKCRFLAHVVDTNHPERIKTDTKWAEMLDTISATVADFAFKRPLLTLEERKQNFLVHGLGSTQLVTDIWEIEGEPSVDDFLQSVKAKAWQNHEKRENQQNDDDE